MEKELLNIQLASLFEECPYPDRKKGLFFVHDFEYNGNGLKIPEELASQYLDSLNGAPLVAYYNPVSDDIENHKETRDAKGKIIALNTDACGTILNAHIGSHEIDGVDKYGVWADGYLWLRFGNTINAIENLMLENGKVDVSVECQVGAYEFSEEGRIAQSYLNYFGTALLGNKYSGAYKDAGLYALNNLEVAEAYKKDLQINKLENQHSSLDINNLNNGGVQRLLSHEEIRSQLQILLNPKNNSENDYHTDYWTWDMTVYDDSCVARKADDGKLYRFNYEIQNENIVVLTSEPKEQMIQYIDVPQDTIVEVSEWVEKFKEMDIKVKELSQNLEQKEQELNSQIAELNEQKAQLETEVSQLKEDNAGQVQTKDEALISLNSQIESLKQELSTLIPIREEFNKVLEEKHQAEIIQKQEALKNYALNSKVIEVSEFESNQELKDAITEVNEQYVKSFIADRIVQKAQTLEINTSGDIIISAVEQKDLIPESSKDRMYAPKKTRN